MRWQNQGYDARQQVPTFGINSNGVPGPNARWIDVRVTGDGRITDIEIKAKMDLISLSGHTLMEADKDALQLRLNQEASAPGYTLRNGGRFLVGAGLLVDGLNITSRYIEEGEFGPKTQRETASAGGGLAGGWAGAQTGATLFSWGGPWGIGIGGAIGGIGGVSCL